MSDRIYTGGAERLRAPERIQRLEIEKVVKNCLSVSSAKTLLDIGTGSGLFAESFFNAGVKVKGIDINKEFIEEAEKNLPDIEFKIAGAENIPYEDNTFDISFLGLVFHEVADYKKALSEAFRVSRFGTFILEWKYKAEDFGPPIEHRLKADFIQKLSNKTGFISFNHNEMQNLILYSLIKN